MVDGVPVCDYTEIRNEGICNEEINKHINKTTKYRTSTTLVKVIDSLLTAKQVRPNQRPGNSIVHVTRSTSAHVYYQLSP